MKHFLQYFPAVYRSRSQSVIYCMYVCGCKSTFPDRIWRYAFWNAVIQSIDFYSRTLKTQSAQLIEAEWRIYATVNLPSLVQIMACRHVIIWAKAGIFLIPIPETNFNEIWREIHTFSFKKMHFKMSSMERRSFYPGLSVLSVDPTESPHSPIAKCIHSWSINHTGGYLGVCFWNKPRNDVVVSKWNMTVKSNVVLNRKKNTTKKRNNGKAKQKQSLILLFVVFCCGLASVNITNVIGIMDN